MYNTAYRLYTVAYCLIVGGADDAIDAEEADDDEAGDEADDDADDAPRDCSNHGLLEDTPRNEMSGNLFSWSAATAPGDNLC